MTRTIGAIAPWFGSKRTLAPTIVEELGKHSAYWEPFCGSMAVLLAKPPSAQETVNDLHGDLFNLARVIQDPDYGLMFYERLRKTLCSEEIFNDAREALESEPCICPPFLDECCVLRAYYFFVVSWIGRNGVSGTLGYDAGGAAVRWTPNGGHGAVRFASAVDSIPEWHQRLRRTLILRRDGFDVLHRIADVDGVSIYVDPPYFGKRGKYVHDFEVKEHGRLALLLRRFKNVRVVVSYYDHPLLDKYYVQHGWTKRKMYRTKNLSVQARRKSRATVAPEVLLLNGPSFAKE